MEALIKELTEISNGGNNNEINHIQKLTTLFDDAKKLTPKEAEDWTKMINIPLFKALLKAITSNAIMSPITNILCKG